VLEVSAGLVAPDRARGGGHANRDDAACGDNARRIRSPTMTETQGFRLMLVLLASLVLGFGGAWAWLHARQQAAEAAVSASFGDYNRYIAACGDGRDVAAWDLAKRSYDALERASAARDRYAEQAEAVAWIALIAGAVVVGGFYALRWAMTGKVRPLWVLGRDAGPPAGRP
jgi:hypothetical protein